MSYKTRDLGVIQRISATIYETDKPYSQLSKDLGCTNQTLYNYRDGVSVMDVLSLKKLCESTGVSADFILFGYERYKGSE